MAIALENAKFQQATLHQTEMTLIERKRIFRTLHDTFGQNISYLHLKLDQYSDKDSQLNLLEIQQDIGQSAI